MKKIPLTQGQFALVDDEDYKWLMQWNWFATWNLVTKSFYAGRNVNKHDGGRTSLGMHRVIMNASGEMFVDHKNHDTLDNRRDNLRLATCVQNNRNERSRSNNTSGYRGVSLYKRSNQWISYIRVKGVRIHLGYFNTAEEASAVYEAEAKRLFGEFYLDPSKRSRESDQRPDPPDQPVEPRRRSDNISGHTGISWVNRTSNWRCRLGKRHIGFFDTIEEAIRARDDAKSAL